jgi:single-strand DNA-binding protein
MTSVNKVILIGYVGQDPKIRATKGGKKIANVSLATTRKWRDKDGNRMEATQWHTVVVFDPQPLVEAIARDIKKGTHVMVQGELQYRKYQGNDYVDRIAAEVVITGFGSTIEPITGNDAEYGGGGTRPPPADSPSAYGARPAGQRQQIATASDDNDEVPF